jgi:hypothetical protein
MEMVGMDWFQLELNDKKFESSRDRKGKDEHQNTYIGKESIERMHFHAFLEDKNTLVCD